MKHIKNTVPYCDISIKYKIIEAGKFSEQNSDSSQTTQKMTSLQDFTRIKITCENEMISMSRTWDKKNI